MEAVMVQIVRATRRGIEPLAVARTIWTVTI